MDTPTTLRTAAALAMALTLAGCFSSRKEAPPSAQPLSPGLHTLALSATTQGSSTVAVSGVELALVLPAGVDMVYEEPGGTRLAAGSLRPALANAATAMAFGHVLSGPKRVKLTLVATPSAPWNGEFLRVDFRVAEGASVTVDQIQGLRPTELQAVGLDRATRTSEDLTRTITPSLRVVN